MVYRSDVGRAVHDGSDDALRKTLEQLQAQVVINQLEIVVISPLTATFNFDAGELTTFGRVRVAKSSKLSQPADPSLRA